MTLKIAVKRGAAMDMGVVPCPSCSFQHRLTIPLRELVANAKLKVKLTCGCEVDTMKMVRSINEATNR